MPRYHRLALGTTLRCGAWQRLRDHSGYAPGGGEAGSQVSDARRETRFDSLGIDQSGHSTCTFDSWKDAGWRSLLVRRFICDPCADEVMVPPVSEQLIVLVTSGDSTVASRAAGRWRPARYVPGSIGLTAPGQPSELRWRPNADLPLETLHVWLSQRHLRTTIAQVWDRELEEVGLADSLGTVDPVLRSVTSAAAAAAEAGATDFYAESVATYLAVHLATSYGVVRKPAAPVSEDARLRRATDFLHDNFPQPIRLADVAEVAQLSAYHFLRLFKTATGMTPGRYLMALRLAEAARRLRSGLEPVTAIAYDCGFSSPAHLTAAFRRGVGMTPTAYRRSPDRPAFGPITPPLPSPSAATGTRSRTTRTARRGSMPS